MTVTMKEIAERSGVSRPAVSLILRDKADHMRPETRQRVLKVAEELGYRPNRAARATKSGRFDTIGLLLSTGPWSGSISSALVHHLHDALASRGQHMTFAALDDEQFTDSRHVPRILRELSCDGVLINHTIAPPPRLGRLLRRYRVPSIWLNTKRPADCIYPDDADAGYRATRRLIELGHRRVAYVDYALERSRRAGVQHYSKPDRLAGYRRAMREASLPPTVISDGALADGRSEHEHLAAVLGAASRPTALVTYGAANAELLVASHLGLRVPDDLSLVGFGDRQFGPVDTRLTLWVLPQKEIARRGVEMLMEKIARPDAAIEPVRCPLTFEPGCTVQGPPS